MAERANEPIYLLLLRSTLINRSQSGVKRMRQLCDSFGRGRVALTQSVFPEPDSEDLIEEMIAIGMEATPQIITTQESELDWSVSASLLASVTCPTLVLHGEDDVVPVSLVERIAATMPRARLEILPDAGHRPGWRPCARTRPSRSRTVPIDARSP